MDLESKNEIEVKQPMREKLKNSWHRKLVSAGLAASLALVSLGAYTKPADAYDSGTHRQLASDGLLSIGNDKGIDIKGYFYEDNMAQTIMDYSVMPDFDEDSAGHYYNPGTAANYLGDKDNTANVKFCTHYNNAVSLYKDGYKDIAAQELGRALHYFGDLNQPQHAANMPAVGGSRIVSGAHVDYEAWVERKRCNYAKTSAPQSVYNYALNTNVWQMGHDAAVNAKGYSYYIRNLYYELDDRNKRTATINTLPRAEQYTAAIMFKFLVDTEKIKVDTEGNIIK